MFGKINTAKGDSSPIKAQSNDFDRYQCASARTGSRTEKTWVPAHDERGSVEVTRDDIEYALGSASTKRQRRGSSPGKSPGSRKFRSSQPLPLNHDASVNPPRSHSSQSSVSDQLALSTASATDLVVPASRMPAVNTAGARSLLLGTNSAPQDQASAAQAAAEHISSSTALHKPDAGESFVETATEDTERKYCPTEARSSLKRSCSETSAGDCIDKENLVISVSCSTTALEYSAASPVQEPAAETISSASFNRSHGSRPDLKNLVKSFKTQFNKKHNGLKREEPTPEFIAPAAMMCSAGARATRSEVDCDTTDRPGDIRPCPKARRTGPGRIDSVAARAVWQRMAAANEEAGDDSSISTLDAATSDDEGMYAESQMVSYERVAGQHPLQRPTSLQRATTTSPGSQSATRRQSGSDPPPPPPPLAPGSGTRPPQSTEFRSSNHACAKTKVFQLSGFNTKDKLLLQQAIQQLGGVVSENAAWDPSTTHLIANEAKRVEKMLAACARGRWVLRSTYLDASAVANSWVDEAPHELNSCVTNPTLAQAPARCRQMVAQNAALRDNGMFSNMRVHLLITDERRKGIVKRVLLAGGAIVVNTAPNRCVEQNAFVFVDSKGADNQESDARHYTADDMQLLLTRGEFDAKASHLCISNVQ